MTVEAEAPPVVVDAGLPALTRATLVDVMHRRLGFSKRECASLVEDLLQLVEDGLMEDGRVKIVGFGTFEVREKRSRLGRNPATEEALTIDARRVVTFRPSKALRASMNDAWRR